jgi:hypothetical protein
MNDNKLVPNLKVSIGTVPLLKVLEYFYINIVNIFLGRILT